MFTLQFSAPAASRYKTNDLFHFYCIRILSHSLVLSSSSLTFINKNRLLSYLFILIFFCLLVVFLFCTLLLPRIYSFLHSDSVFSCSVSFEFFGILLLLFFFLRCSSIFQTGVCDVQRIFETMKKKTNEQERMRLDKQSWQKKCKKKKVAFHGRTKCVICMQCAHINCIHCS